MMRWAGHVQVKEEGRGPRKALQGKLGGKRLRERLRPIWVVDLEVDSSRNGSAKME